MRGRQMVGQLLRSNVGRSGLILLALLFAATIYVLATYPMDFGTRLWSSPAAWADNPKAVPPVWSNLWQAESRVPHEILEALEPHETCEVAGRQVGLYRFSLEHPYQSPPSFLALTLGDVSYRDRPPLVSVSLIRPDGRTVRLYRHVPRGPREDETPPFRRYHESPLRIRLSSEASTTAAVREFLEAEFGVQVSERDLVGSVDQALFGTPVRNADDLTFEPLQGTYEILVQASFSDAGDRVGLVRCVVGGGVYGWMGTDALGRDLAQGLLFGLPVALFIGLMASILSTSIGAALGIWSGYAGGRTDQIIQRLADVVANVPLLPLLIFLLFVAGPNLYLTILILVAFSWPGLTILVRSMVLQMRTGQLVEAIQSLGASPSRVMFRHILPQVAPYLLAQLIFLAPSAILAEAGLSFLGLGDPSIPTWGQILEHGFRTGAVYVGYWWWVVPPGLLIVLTAVTFMLLALALEAVVNPRLQRSS